MNINKDFYALKNLIKELDNLVDDCELIEYGDYYETFTEINNIIRRFNKFKKNYLGVKK